MSGIYSITGSKPSVAGSLMPRRSSARAPHKEITSMSIDHDDPRLTAYALGELDPAERAQFETEIQGEPDALVVVPKSWRPRSC